MKKAIVPRGWPILVIGAIITVSIVFGGIILVNMGPDHEYEYVYYKTEDRATLVFHESEMEQEEHLSEANISIIFILNEKKKMTWKLSFQEIRSRWEGNLSCRYEIKKTYPTKDQYRHKPSPGKWLPLSMSIVIESDDPLLSNKTFLENTNTLTGKMYIDKDKTYKIDIQLEKEKSMKDPSGLVWVSVIDNQSYSPEIFFDTSELHLSLEIRSVVSWSD